MAHHCSISTELCRKGLYPIDSFPQALGNEASGIIAALPSDDALAQNEEYQKRGFKVGSKVAVVSSTILLFYSGLRYL